MQYPAFRKKQIPPVTGRPTVHARPSRLFQRPGSWQRGAHHYEEGGSRATSFCPQEIPLSPDGASNNSRASEQCGVAVAEATSRLTTAPKQGRTRPRVRFLKASESLLSPANRRPKKGCATSLQCLRDLTADTGQGRCNAGLQGEPTAASANRRRDIRRQCLGDFLADSDADDLSDSRDGGGRDGPEEARGSSGPRTDLEIGGPMMETNGAATRAGR